MKRKLTLALALLLCAALALSACGKQEEDLTAAYQQQIAALEQENEALKNQVDILTGQLESLQSAVLNDWSLQAKASADRHSATITFTAVPASQPEGQTVNLIVTLNGFEAESVQCAPDGNRYVATLELPAADGYSYYCLLTSAGGTQQQISLVTPDNGENNALVNLGSSLNAYCNLFVDSWDYADGKLTIASAYAQAQMPMISAGGDDVTMSSAELVFLHNGEELQHTAVTMAPGEAEGSYETALTDISFETPKLEDDHQLDLLLVVTLSSGEEITYNGCSWYVSGGKLNPVMG